MAPIRRTTEKKFWRGLSKVFNNLIYRIRHGSGSAEQMAKEVRNFLNSPEVGRTLNRTIINMVGSTRMESASEWKERSLRSAHARKIYEAIKHEMQGPVGERVYELIRDNIRYIKSIPNEWAEYIIQYALDMALKGKRPEAIEKELRKVIPEKMHGKLKLIARTEYAKANAAIVQARAEAVGIKAYIWRSMSDERTRGSHGKMDGVLVFYDDPPNPEKLFPVPTGKKGTGKPPKPYGNYHAGNTFNCRCYQEPVVDMSFLPDTIDVHDHGRIIKNMTREQIKRKYGDIAA